MTFSVKEGFLVEAAFVEEKGTLDKEKVVKEGFFGKAKFFYKGVLDKEDF